MARVSKSTPTFKAPCERCEGSGLWHGREGYTCHACGGEGMVLVAAIRKGHSWSLRPVTAKGTIQKSYYRVAAELAEPYDRFHSGATIGSGHYCAFTGTDPAGASCGVYSVLGRYDEQDEVSLSVELPGGGYSTTGEHPPPDYATGARGNERIAVRIPDVEAAHFLALLVQERREAGPFIEAAA